MKVFENQNLKVDANKAQRTFTICKMEDGKCYAKYRTYPQTKDDFHYYCEFATENDWKQLLKSNDYYSVR